MPSLPTILIHILNVSIGILSLIILSLVAHTTTLTSSPPYVRDTGSSLLFWPGCGGLVDMFLFIHLWQLTPTAHAGKDRKRKHFWNGLVFVASFIFGRPAVTMIYTFVEWGRAAKGEVLPVKGYVTTETWACAAVEEGSVRNAGSICIELRTVRYILIPEVVLGAAMLALVIWMRMKVATEKKANEQVVAPDAKI